MDDASQFPEDSGGIQWDGFIKSLINQGIKQKFARWHVIRAEEFLKAFPDRKITDLTSDDVVTYLEQLGRKRRLNDWQFRQAVEAIRLLFPYMSVHMEKEVDWDFWLNSSKTLSPDHRTIAREQGISDNQATKKSPVNSSNVGSIDDQGVTDLVTEIRRRHYAISTEQTYEGWLRRFMHFHHRDPRELHVDEVIQFLDHLVIKRNVSASTQNVALNALVFYYDKVCKRPLGDLEGFKRATKPRRLPVVLSRDEVALVLKTLTGTHWLMAALMYGSGMRLMECIRLRTLDMDFNYGRIIVRHGKGGKDRHVPFPESLAIPMREHLEKTRQLHTEDLANGYGSVFNAMMFIHMEVGIYLNI